MVVAHAPSNEELAWQVLGRVVTESTCDVQVFMSSCRPVDRFEDQQPFINSVAICGKLLEEEDRE
jgi:hypothetical protein